MYLFRILRSYPCYLYHSQRSIRRWCRIARPNSKRPYREISKPLVLLQSARWVIRWWPGRGCNLRRRGERRRRRLWARVQTRRILNVEFSFGRFCQSWSRHKYFLSTRTLLVHRDVAGTRTVNFNSKRLERQCQCQRSRIDPRRRGSSTSGSKTMTEECFPQNEPRDRYRRRRLLTSSRRSYTALRIRRPNPRNASASTSNSTDLYKLRFGCRNLSQPTLD
jgi:hypothetical protein